MTPAPHMIVAVSICQATLQSYAGFVTFNHGVTGDDLYSKLAQLNFGGCGKGFRKRRQKTRTCLHQHDPCRRGIDVAEVTYNRVAGEFGNGACHLYTCWPAAYDNKGQEPLPIAVIHHCFCFFKSQQGGVFGYPWLRQFSSVRVPHFPIRRGRNRRAGHPLRQ